ncbi:MAG TPA: SRPBCC domain-containing protein [Anaerolineaceae bacterium]
MITTTPIQRKCDFNNAVYPDFSFKKPILLRKVMMAEKLNLSTLIPAEPEKVYLAWLDSAGHTAITGSPAKIDGRIGGKFTAWDGYIEGTTLELQPFQRILQSWRTSEFPDSSPNSQLEMLFEPAEGGTRLTLIHTNIPDGQAEEYRQGWEDFYFTPMTSYFSE